MVYVEEEADDSPLHCPTPIVAFLTVKRNRKDKGRDAYAFPFFLSLRETKHHKREVGVIHDLLFFTWFISVIYIRVICSILLLQLLCQGCRAKTQRFADD